jgi:hypothetical protein
VALGARSLKPGHTRFFVGYKKHSLRLWLHSHPTSVQLMPIVSWITPADVPEGYLLKPSLHYCWRRFAWRPDIVVGDLGYIHGQTKREIRETWQVAVVTKMKSDMRIIAPFASARCVTCPQGQPLQWLEYDALADRHCFGVREAQPLCGQCWEVSRCPQEFEYAPGHHETLLGLIPLSTLPAQQLLGQARSWIEPCQSFEKNVLGLNAQFLNSLRLTWSMGLLADAVVLLRQLTLLETTPSRERLENLLPRQAVLDLGL